MTDKISETTKVTTESEISSNGVGHSTHSSLGEVKASPEELTKALIASNQTIDAMAKEIAELKKAKATAESDSSIDKLTNAITAAISGAKKEPTGPIGDNLNKVTDYSQRTLVDGASMMEAQATLMSFKNERKIPISIPKTFANQFGPSLAVSVNGVRVSIPCDGKTYYINETHAEAARERMAKVDRLLADTEPQIKEINA